jgi:hypothetical protein
VPTAAAAPCPLPPACPLRRGYDASDGVDGASAVLAEISRRVFMVYMRM